MKWLIAILVLELSFGMKVVDFYSMDANTAKALIAVAKGDRETALKYTEALKSDVDHESVVLPAVKTINDCFDYLFLSFLANKPQKLSELGLLESIGLNKHNQYLNDISPAALIQRSQKQRVLLQTLEQFPPETLGSEDKLSYALFLWSLRESIAGERFLFHEYKINQLEGVVIDQVLVFTESHLLRDQEDCENYITRLAKIPLQLEQAIALFEHQKQLGITYPACALEKAMNALKAIVPADKETCVFYTHFKQQLNTLESIESSAKDKLLEDAYLAIKRDVYPAYGKLSNYCNALLQSTAKNNHGIWALPQGDEYYAYMLKQHTTLELTADEIHQLGLQEVQKILDEIKIILTLEGMSVDSKSTKELLENMKHDSRFYYSNTSEGRKACIEDFEKILERSRQQLSHLFGIKPSSLVKVKTVPAHHEEGSGVAYYFNSSFDGTRPGTFFINLRDMREIPSYTMETTAIHEAEPGHHFQLALQQEIDLPPLRKLGEYTAFVEGWALYAEKLAYEHNFYSSLWSKLGYLTNELLRAARLVVDTGLHSKKWSREEAIEYMRETTFLPLESIVTEVERYLVLPGQACSYKIGQLKILELRAYAQKVLGKNFDIREFHDVILTSGAMPLTVLEEVVKNYVQSEIRSLNSIQ